MIASHCHFMMMVMVWLLCEWHKVLIGTTHSFFVFFFVFGVAGTDTSIVSLVTLWCFSWDVFLQSYQVQNESSRDACWIWYLEGTGPPEEFEVVNSEFKLTQWKYDGSLDSHVLPCNLLCSSSKSFFFLFSCLKVCCQIVERRTIILQILGVCQSSHKRISRLEYKHDRDVLLIVCFMWCKTGDPDNIAGWDQEHVWIPALWALWLPCSNGGWNQC